MISIKSLTILSPTQLSIIRKDLQMIKSRQTPGVQTSLASIIVFLCFVIAFPARSAAGTAPPTIDLRPDGYPPAACDFITQDTGGFPRRHVEFLDARHLLVSFPLWGGEQCKTAATQGALNFRSVIFETTGKRVSSFDWSRPNLFNVQSGPDGTVAEITPAGIRLVDQSFHLLQEIPLGKDELPKAIPPGPFSIQLAPSRHAFAAIFPQFSGAGFNGYSVYFAGAIPMQQTISQPTDAVVVGDGAMISLYDPHRLASSTKTFDLASRHYSCAPAYWIALPAENHPICLTASYQLVELTPAGGQSTILDLHSLAPGANSGIGYLLSDAGSQRILLYSYGARFQVSDSRNIGNYFKVAVVDLRNRQLVFRQSFPEKSDVALSPDGRSLVILEKAHLATYYLP